MGIRINVDGLTITCMNRAIHWIRRDSVQELVHTGDSLLVVLDSRETGFVDVALNKENCEKLLHDMMRYGWPTAERTRHYENNPQDEDQIPF